MTLDSFIVPFGQWLPDISPTDNPGCLDARNVVPSGEGYRAVRDGSPFGPPAPEPPIGSFWLKNAANAVLFFIGTRSDLFRYRTTGDGWDRVSRPGGYQNVQDWEFARFGSRVIATNGVTVPQYIDVDDPAPTTFVDLPGAPLAHRIGIVRDFVVLGDVGGVPNRVQWSGFFNSEIWGAPNPRFQADFQLLFGNGGRVQRIVSSPSGDGIIFQEHAIWRMTYVGPQVVFRFDRIAEGRGTPSAASVVNYGDRVFFYGWDGFYALDGNGFRPIGHARIDRWFSERMQGDRSVDRIRGAIDRRNSRVFWFFEAFAGPRLDFAYAQVVARSGSTASVGIEVLSVTSAAEFGAAARSGSGSTLEPELLGDVTAEVAARSSSGSALEPVVVQPQEELQPLGGFVAEGVDEFSAFESTVPNVGNAALVVHVFSRALDAGTGDVTAVSLGPIDNLLTLVNESAFDEGGDLFYRSSVWWAGPSVLDEGRPSGVVTISGASGSMGWGATARYFSGVSNVTSVGSTGDALDDPVGTPVGTPDTGTEDDLLYFVGYGYGSTPAVDEGDPLSPSTARMQGLVSRVTNGQASTRMSGDRQPHERVMIEWEVPS